MGPSWVQHLPDSGQARHLLGPSVGLPRGASQLPRRPALTPGACDPGFAPMVRVLSPCCHWVSMPTAPPHS